MTKLLNAKRFDRKIFSPQVAAKSMPHARVARQNIASAIWRKEKGIKSSDKACNILIASVAGRQQALTPGILWGSRVDGVLNR